MSHIAPGSCSQQIHPAEAHDSRLDMHEEVESGQQKQSSGVLEMVAVVMLAQKRVGFDFVGGRRRVEGRLQQETAAVSICFVDEHQAGDSCSLA